MGANAAPLMRRRRVFGFEQEDCVALMRAQLHGGLPPLAPPPSVLVPLIGSPPQYPCPMPVMRTPSGTGSTPSGFVAFDVLLF